MVCVCVKVLDQVRDRIVGEEARSGEKPGTSFDTSNQRHAVTHTQQKQKFCYA
jgi:hypothetical protein